jgi:phage terminase small subunit
MLEGSVPQAKSSSKILKQNPQAKPAFVGGRPKFPKHLSPVSRAEFKRCVQLLEQRGTVTPGDGATRAAPSSSNTRPPDDK